MGIIYSVIYTHRFIKEVNMKPKQDTDTLERAFFQSKVLDMKQVCEILNTKSRITGFRYLRDLKYLTSYTHSATYYTLPYIARFEDDFWHYGDVGFSRYGTLIKTLEHIISTSDFGKTNSELEKQCRIRVQNSLQKLLKNGRIKNSKSNKSVLYINVDPIIGKKQSDARLKRAYKKRLAPWIVAEVLIETIKSLSEIPNVDVVMKRLLKRGSSITREQVQQVFDEEDLEKKSLD